MKPLFAALFVVVLLAGCGSSGGGSSSSSTPPATAQPAASAGGASTSSISLKGIAFNPELATVKVGQKITWTNEDSVAHNVIGGPLKSSTLNQGDTYSYTPTKPGTISYVCTFHSNMKATLKVVS